tara:strand:- start:99 stop:290 length:192 start_codon:yes stop_codon:yes gene_type:complete
MKRRYVVTISFYVWEDNDDEAIKVANEFAKNIDDKEDNRCSVDSIHEQEFGSFHSRELKLDKH